MSEMSKIKRTTERTRIVDRTSDRYLVEIVEILQKNSGVINTSKRKRAKGTLAVGVSWQKEKR
jgi:hypothetical protein